MIDYFAGRVAERTTATGRPSRPVDPVVDFLEPLADGAALELGIGTGRIALPLAAARRSRARDRPLAGHGRAAAREARRRGDPGLDRRLRDRRRVDGSFSLVYLVFNTIINLTTQDAQVACFQNAAAHLEPGGCFVIEVGVPDQAPLGEVFDLSVQPTTSASTSTTRATQGTRLAPLRDRRRRVESDLDAVPLRLALRARPDGAARGDAARERWAGWDASRSPPRRSRTSRSGCLMIELRVRSPTRTSRRGPQSRVRWFRTSG